MTLDSRLSPNIPETKAKDAFRHREWMGGSQRHSRIRFSKKKKGFGE